MLALVRRGREAAADRLEALAEAARLDRRDRGRRCSCSASASADVWGGYRREPAPRDGRDDQAALAQAREGDPLGAAPDAAIRINDDPAAPVLAIAAGGRAAVVRFTRSEEPAVVVSPESRGVPRDHDSGGRDAMEARASRRTSRTRDVLPHLIYALQTANEETRKAARAFLSAATGLTLPADDAEAAQAASRVARVARGRSRSRSRSDDERSRAGQVRDHQRRRRAARRARRRHERRLALRRVAARRASRSPSGAIVPDDAGRRSPTAVTQAVDRGAGRDRRRRHRPHEGRRHARRRREGGWASRSSSTRAPSSSCAGATPRARSGFRPGSEVQAMLPRGFEPGRQPRRARRPGSCGGSRRRIT